jgi:hypothetical protein
MGIRASSMGAAASLALALGGGLSQPRTGRSCGNEWPSFLKQSPVTSPRAVVRALKKLLFGHWKQVNQ